MVDVFPKHSQKIVESLHFSTRAHGFFEEILERKYKKGRRV